MVYKMVELLADDLMSRANICEREHAHPAHARYIM